MDYEDFDDIEFWNASEETRKELAALLRNEGARLEERLEAAIHAGSIPVIDDELAGVLLSIVGQNGAPVPLRARAAIALGPVLEYAEDEGFVDSEDVPISEDTYHNIQDTLRMLYREQSIPKEVRRRVLEASVRAPCDWHKDAVRAAYYSDDGDWRLTAVFAMRYVASFDEQILEALESEDEQLRAEAILAAGTWEVEGARPHVMRLLRQPGSPGDLFFAAIHAAGALGGEEAIELLQEYSRSSDPEIAAAADEALLFTDAEIDWEEFGWDDEEEED